MNIKNIVLDQIENVRKIGDIYRGACPLCGGGHQSRAFIVFETGCYFCHICEESGTPQRLLTELGVDYQGAEYIAVKREIVKQEDIDFTQYANMLLSDAKKHHTRTLELFHELIPKDTVGIDTSLLKGLIGYDSFNDTLAVMVKDGDKVINIKRRKVGNIKWMGMKASNGKYAPHRLTRQRFVCIASGMAEFLILAASGMDFIVTQSDSADISHLIQDDIVAIIFEDNDLTKITKPHQKQWADAVHTHMFNRFSEKVTSKITGRKVIINFNNMCDIDKPIGYDLRDFVTEYPTKWLDMTKAEISKWIEWKLI